MTWQQTTTLLVDSATVIEAIISHILDASKRCMATKHTKQIRMKHTHRKARAALQAGTEVSKV